MTRYGALSLACLLLMIPCRLSSVPIELFVVWNIGQGQWVTAVTSTTCWHFDVGGEKSYYQKVQRSVLRLCGKKQNRALLSHADLDHIRWAPRLIQILPGFCVARGPVGPLTSKKAEFLKKLTQCEEPLPPELEEVTAVGPKLSRGTSLTNLHSRVFAFRKWALIPGDAPQIVEKSWQLTHASTIKILLLGHHGSRTSTSYHLLQKLTSLQLAIASSRKAMYGHPHREVVQKLKKYSVPLLRTEDWGTIGLHL